MIDLFLVRAPAIGMVKLVLLPARVVSDMQCMGEDDSHHQTFRQASHAFLPYSSKETSIACPSSEQQVDLPYQSCPAISLSSAKPPCRLVETYEFHILLRTRMSYPRNGIVSKGMVFRTCVSIVVGSGLVAEFEETLRILQPLDMAARKVLWVSSGCEDLTDETASL